MQLFISVINFFLFPVLRLYWRIFSPATTGVRVLVKHGDSVLFVQHSYGHKEWTLPGGGVKKGEDLGEAAKREVFEETGIVLREVSDKGSFLYGLEGKQDTVHVFVGEVSDEYYKIDNFEIQNARWERIDSPTLTKSPIVRKCFLIAGYSLKE